MVQTQLLYQPVLLAEFKDHPSVKAIKKNVSTSSLLHFTEIGVSEMTKELFSLNCKKAGTFGNIPTKVFMASSDICNKELRNIWNSEILGKQCFPENSKLADMTSFYKKKDTMLAKYYRPVSVLPTVSKVFEQIISKIIISSY